MIISGTVLASILLIAMVMSCFKMSSEDDRKDYEDAEYINCD